MKGSYSNLNKIRNTINKWQNGHFHPLTCGNDSQKHEVLVPQLDLLSEKEDLYELTLNCKNCDWKQDIPDFFTNGVVLDDFQ